MPDNVQEMERKLIRMGVYGRLVAIDRRITAAELAQSEAPVNLNNPNKEGTP